MTRRLLLTLALLAAVLIAAKANGIYLRHWAERQVRR